MGEEDHQQKGRPRGKDFVAGDKCQSVVGSDKGTEEEDSTKRTRDKLFSVLGLKTGMTSRRHLEGEKRQGGGGGREGVMRSLGVILKQLRSHWVLQKRGKMREKRGGET